MNRIILYLFLTVGFYHLALAQSVRTVTSLSDKLVENSGIVHFGGGVLYFINDGGNGTKLHRYDTASRTYADYDIINATNIDWEDLSKDDERNLYIGDFGNNSNSRQNLRIFKSVDPESVFTNELMVDTISFSFSNQNEFPPSEDKLNYDCEAMMWYQDSLYLFTKNRTNPYDGWCYMYVLPDEPGSYIAQLRDSVQFKATAKEFGWITAADLRGDSLLLLTSNKVHLGVGFGQKSLGDMNWESFNVGFSQKEAVSFGAKSTDIFISDELNIIGNNLYHLDISSRLSIEKIKVRRFDVFQTAGTLHIKLKKRGQALVRVHSLLGDEIYTMFFDKEIVLRGDMLALGTYIIELVVDGESYDFKWAKTE